MGNVLTFPIQPQRFKPAVGVTEEQLKEVMRDYFNNPDLSRFFDWVTHVPKDYWGHRLEITVNDHLKYTDRRQHVWGECDFRQLFTLLDGTRFTLEYWGVMSAEVVWPPMTAVVRAPRASQIPEWMLEFYETLPGPWGREIAEGLVHLLVSRQPQAGVTFKLSTEGNLVVMFDRRAYTKVELKFQPTL